VLVVAAGVGPAGVPVNVGDARLAFNANPAATKAVVAILVVLLPAACVGAVGVPVSAGEAKGALSVSFASIPSSMLFILVALADVTPLTHVVFT
jgi:hypothetical protein